MQIFAEESLVFRYCLNCSNPLGESQVLPEIHYLFSFKVVAYIFRIHDGMTAMSSLRVSFSEC